MNAVRVPGPGRARGFTLLEVLIALAIVAMAVGALLGTVTSSASSIIYLKEKTIAEWVALNRLTEVRIAKNMPDLGKRTGNAEMGGMRWQWEEDVTELPIKGMLRVEVRARPTGETVDDTRPTQKASAQKESDSTSSGSETDKLNWTTTAIGVISTARSDRMTPVAAAYTGNLQGGPNNPGGANPPPGGAPIGPNPPGTTPPPKNPPSQ
jgi:general secretion pathway protein I